ncbi:YjbH domain-containing protein [Marinomonas sp. C2222]|uniref:YjbH domain-containing protein n=1 Tax=Marinomonas sargassi TaxID=2984494 RepID=A0ABT2YP56_9GAMM|nr:YjbH domain-containing protein [Marinomonas sargassi]MCV2401657.1 YjbH domain-containing protein [Marinomonas sargassi]
MNSNAETDLHFGEPFQSSKLRTSQMDLGGVGIMQMPSARMADEGTLSFGYSHNDEYQFYTLSFQLMPWLESVIRYTEVDDVLYSSDESFSGDTSYADKGLDTKIKLWKESHLLPDLSVGLRDIGGTGLFDGEFIAASKNFSTESHGQFDFTLGIGWGYLGTRGTLDNPLCSTAEHFCNRSAGFSGNGGSIDFQRWFTGRSSFFGGIVYQPPSLPLQFKLEYDGNDYSSDRPVTNAGVNMTPETPWNFGAVYSVNDAFNLRLGYERGTTLTLGFTLAANLNTLPTISHDAPIKVAKDSRPTTLDEVNWEDLTQSLYQASGYQTKSIHTVNNQVSVVATQDKYRDRNKALERASSIFEKQLPSNIESYEVIEENQGLPLVSTKVSAEKFQHFINVEYLKPKIEDTYSISPSDYLNTSSIHIPNTPLNFSLYPHLNQSFGSPESFYLYNLSINAEASYWLNSKLLLSGVASTNLVNNYDKLNFTVPSDGTSNYRVRTLIRAYVQESDSNIKNLQLTMFQKYEKNWYQQFYAGYLERMFAGIGSEVLYRPINSNWAIGADWNSISQRDPDSTFGLFDSENSYGNNAKVLANGTTGHISLYYLPQWSLLNDTLLQVDAGKFLATDVGVRFDFSKQYKSGVIVGAFASKTNLSAEEFGEGSFTKGFYLSMPFDTLSLKPTTRRVKAAWQPILRDGGQKLSRKHSLFNLTDTVSPWFQRPNQN